MNISESKKVPRILLFAAGPVFVLPPRYQAEPARFVGFVVTGVLPTGIP
jgi:hypothetical protein